MSLWKLEWEVPEDDATPTSGQYRGTVLTLYDDDLPGWFKAEVLAEKLSEGGWYNIACMGEAHGPLALPYTWMVAGRF